MALRAAEGYLPRMTLGRGRSRPRAAWQAAAGVLTALSLGQGLASANHLDDFKVIEPSCRYLEAGAPGPAENKLEVSLGNYEDVEIERVDDRIRVNEMDDSLHREVTCEFGRATVHNIDSITLISAPTDEDFEEVYFENELSIDLQAGLLEPGATPEPDGSEIELAMAGDRSFLTDLYLITPDVEDQIRATTTLSGTGINLNAAEATPDVDMELPPVLFGGIYAGGGNDVVIAETKIKENIPFPFGIGVLGEKGDDLIKASQAVGGEGNDTLVGGAQTDLLVGGEGNDSVRGKNSRDLLVSGGGRDRLRAGGDGDFLFAADGNGDQVQCGDGRDRAIIDLKDKRTGCERMRRVRGVDADDVSGIPFKTRLRTRSGKKVF